MDLITAPNDKSYKDLILYLSRRVVDLTTKVKTCKIGDSQLYFNYSDEIIAIALPHERSIELTHKMDGETSSGLKRILGGTI